MAVDMIAVKSGNIESVGHDPAKNELHVKFKATGQTYVHSNVKAEHHKALMGAESVGKHYAAVFRGKEAFPHRPLEAKPALP